MIKMKKLALMMAMVSGTLVGCQTMSAQSNTVKPLDAAAAAPFGQSDEVQASELLASQSKSALKSGVQALLRTSFSYRSQVFAAVPPSEHTEPTKSCEVVHDEGYVNLSKTAKEAGLDVSADDYIEDRKALKDAYLACQRDLLVQASKGEFTPPTKEAPKKDHRLIDAYFVKPSSLGVVGNYQPLRGVISALPTFEYHFGQMDLMVNQPVHIDMRAGELYLWADNLALANATWLDKELGDGWQNKWLRLPMNDGSLPESFVKDFWRAYLQASAHSFEEMSDEHFFERTPAVMLEELDGVVLDDNAVRTIQGAERIVRQDSNKITRQEAKQAKLLHFYEAMIAKYPLLTEKADVIDDDGKVMSLDSRAFMQVLFARIKSIADGNAIKSYRDILSESQAELETDYAAALEAEMWATAAAEAAAATAVEEAKQEQQSDLATQAASDAVNDAMRDKPQVVSLEEDISEGLSQEESVLGEAEEDMEEQTTYYGFVKGKLVWVYHKRSESATILSDKPLSLGVLTVIDGTPEPNLFSRLPKEVATPSHANSVNLLQYGNTLFNNLKESDSIYLRSLMYYLTEGLDGDSKASGERRADVESAADDSGDAQEEGVQEAVEGSENTTP